MDDEILDESLRWLWAHTLTKWGDRNPWDAFNRLLAKSISAPGWKDGDHMDIQPHQIRSHREKRSTDELAKFPRPHCRDNPLREDCPIIVAVYEGEERLLDGHTRINYWVKQRNTEDHDVNIHVIEQSEPTSKTP
jgi:hypothetical protein